MYTEEQQQDDCSMSNLLACFGIDSSEEIDLCVVFSAACALYWYCSDYHSGQFSDEYEIMRTVKYKPGALENGVEEGTTDYDVYCELVNGGIQPRSLLKIIQEWHKE